jgi:hypothetical protein
MRSRDEHVADGVASTSTMALTTAMSAAMTTVIATTTTTTTTTTSPTTSTRTSRCGGRSLGIRRGVAYPSRVRIRYAIVLLSLGLAGCLVGREGVRDRDGQIVRLDGSFGRRDAGLDGGGIVVLPDGAFLLPDGAVVPPFDGGGVSRPDGAVVLPDGAVVLPDGAIVGPDGAVLRPDGGRPRDGSVAPFFEVECDDAIDDDGDGRTDCADLDDCEAATCDLAGNVCAAGVCGGCRGAARETMCGDGADEDCDGRADCADSDCAGVACGPGVVCGGGACPCPSGFSERACGDGVDDDCDGRTDCVDPDCNGRACDGTGRLCSSGVCTCSASVDFCNGADEDCDGTPDDGCPRAIGLCCPSSAGGYGSGAGTAFTEACPAGTVLMGIAGRAGFGLDRLQPICAALTLETDREARPEFAYSVRRGAAMLGTARGGTGGTAFDDRCPGNDVVIGIRGSADEIGGVDSIALQCGTLSVSRAGFSFRLTITPTVTTPTRGSGGSTSFIADCPSGAITDVSGSASTTIQRLSFTCRQIQLQTI